MKVYVLETGSYEDRGITGVYSTADAAMAAANLPTREASGPSTRVVADVATGTRQIVTTFSRPAWKWIEADDGSWYYAGMESASVTPYEVQT